MKEPREPVFLARQSYRRRRLMDAARLLPLLGALLVFLPILWSPGGRTAAGLIYLFLVWLVLIGVVAVLSRRLADPDLAPEDPDEDS